ncbi:hypothetical protein Droror1_Dr00006537 [Drosera rotundifolia]
MKAAIIPTHHTPPHAAPSCSRHYQLSWLKSQPTTTSPPTAANGEGEVRQLSGGGRCLKQLRRCKANSDSSWTVPSSLGSGPIGPIDPVWLNWTRIAGPTSEPDIKT